VTGVSLWWLSYPLLGAVAGVLAGLLGVGGGAVMVPVLTSLFVAQGFGGAHLVHLALGTSMAAIMLTSVSSLRAHHRHGAVLWPVVAAITPGILLGTFGATFVAARLPSRPLAIFFACFMAYVALQMLLNIRPRPHRDLPGSVGTSLVGVVIGGISALVAIGGGSLTVPFLTWCNVRMQNAIGTSAAVGLPISVAGSLGYLANGWGSAGLPEHSLGFVYVPAFLLVTVASTLTAPHGARLAHRLPGPTLKKIFAALVILLCAKMLHSVFA
jgi:uncharacterized membrane protein YfcA